MQVNESVYGARSTWRRDANGFSSSSDTPDDMQFKRGEYDTIQNYVTQTRMEQGKPIDYSVCYAAQAEGMPLSSLRTWNSEYINGGWVATTYKRNVQTGWFFGHSTNGGYQTNLLCSHSIFANVEDTNIHDYYWTPNGTIQNYPKQPSARLIPIVEFNTRSCYFGICCRVYNSSTNTFQNRYLSELQTGDWSAWKIVSAWGELYTYYSSDANFQSVTVSSSNKCSVCPNEPMEFIPENAGTNALPVLNYNLYEYSSRMPIFGWIDNEYVSARIDGVYHCMQRVFDTTTVSSSYAPIFVDSVPNATFNILSYSSWGQGFEGYCDINADNLEAIRKAAAAYGLFFTEKDPYTSAIRTNPNRWISNDMFCGVLDANGVGHGDYTRGTGNRDNAVYNMGSSTNSNYNPTTPPTPIDTNTYSITTGFNTVGNVASTTKAYVVNAAALNGLSNELWTIVDNLLVNPSDIDNLYNMSLDTFLTNNPIDAIVSVKKFPLDHVPHGETLTNVYLGKYATGAAGYELTAQQLTYNFTGITIFPKFGNCFLDYAPYTKMQLYVPFCGTIDIDAADFMGRTLSVEMAMDFITGNVTAYVLANQLVVTSLTGTCAIDIPITGTEQATVSSAYESAAITERQARKSEIVQGANVIMHPIKTAMNPVDRIGERTGVALDRAKAQYDLTHIQMPLRQIGQASPLNSWALEFVCRLIIYYPDGECISFNATNEPSLIDDKVKQFGAVNGFATVETGTLSSYSGFTQISEIDLTGVTATETEKDMIINLLVNGVYL